MKQTQATRRLGEQLREKLGYILLFEVSDPRLDLVTLTAVEVAGGPFVRARVRVVRREPLRRGHGGARQRQGPHP